MSDQPRKKFKQDDSDEVLESAVNSILDTGHPKDEDQDLETYLCVQDHVEESNENVVCATDTKDLPAVETSDTISVTSHCDIIAEHYNTLEERGIRARGHSRIYHMRNFNNWIKSALLSSFIKRVKDEMKKDDLCVLDLGCGKGGDLYKWRDGGVKHVVFADLAETSIQQCKARYDDLKRRTYRERKELFTAEFISADCTKVRLRDKFKDPSIMFDLVSCQFAFHYCWESLPQAECMVRNASERLREGGYFVGTCPNSNTIMSRVRKAGGKKFGNSVYDVTFDTEYTEDKIPPLFGAKYNFHLEEVVDCPEFLVHFPTFQRLADQYGLSIRLKQPFHSFYKDKVRDPELAALLQKMKALEAYPPSPEGKLVADDAEYSHVRDCAEKCVGTLSKSEWEAATLYLIFAFKKVQDPVPDS